MTQADPTHTPGISDLVPGTLEWRITVAETAHWFFNPLHPQRAAMAALIDKPFQEGVFDIWNASDFTKYIQKIGMQPGDATAIIRILAAMEHAGLLLYAGWDAGCTLLGHRYVQQGKLSAQTQGKLWLSDVLGADLIIEAYKLVTVEISGTDSPRWGTGLVLDSSHVITNKHVTRALKGHKIEIRTRVAASGEEAVTQQTRVHEHAELDVAVIAVEPPESGSFTPLPGMVFRDPAWADEVYLLGYPRVPWMAGTDVL